MKKVGVIGSGVVGKVLSAGFRKHGYDVMIGSRDPSKLQEWIETDAQVEKSGTFEETAAFADIVVLATKGTAAMDALKLAGASSLSGKTIIDATNPIADAPPENGVLKFTTTLDRSLMEDLQDAFPESKFVKAFNSVGNAFMIDPDFGGIKPTMFIAGNNENAKAEVTDILGQFGWESEDMGGAEAARAIEPLCILYCIPGFRSNQWNHAFKLLKK